MEGAGTATALSGEMTGGFPRGAEGKEQWPALFEEKRSQSRPVEVINKRQHVLNAQEIPPFCGINLPTDVKESNKLGF